MNISNSGYFRSNAKCITYPFCLELDLGVASFSSCIMKDGVLGITNYMYLPELIMKKNGLKLLQCFHVIQMNKFVHVLRKFIEYVLFWDCSGINISSYSIPTQICPIHAQTYGGAYILRENALNMFFHSMQQVNSITFLSANNNMLVKKKENNWAPEIKSLIEHADEIVPVAAMEWDAIAEHH